VTQNLDQGRLEQGLAATRFPYQLRFYAQVGSTQDLVATAAAAGAAEGLVVLADEQLAGRGREGRSWTAPAGSSLMFSVLFRPESSPPRAATLSLVAGLALVEGLALAGGPPARLKWPNDCLCGERKLAGVLLEARPAGGRLALVLGVGCNVEWAGRELPPDLRESATACDAEGFPVDRTALAESVLTRLAARYQEWVGGGFAGLRRAWLGHAAWLGEEVVAAHSSGTVRGTVLGISDEGELLLQTPRGPVTIAAGETQRVAGPQLRRAGSPRSELK